MKKTTRILHIGLHKVEEDIAEKMASRGQNVAEIVRSWFRDYGEKHFPPVPLYAQIQKDRLEFKKENIKDELNFKKMTPEDYAENVLKARVAEGKAWFTTPSTYPYPVPIKLIKEWSLESDIVATHIKILNGDKAFASNGQEVTAKDRKEAISNWKKAGS